MTYGLNARVADYPDLDAFVALAKMHMAEVHPGETFNDGNARFTFAGFARADPAIVMLENHKKRLVGFVTATVRRAPFCEGLVALQDDMFILPEFRSGDSEAFLLLALHHWTSSMMPRPAETKLSVSSAPGGLLELDHLQSVGFRIEKTTLRLCGKPLTPVMPTAQ